MSWVNRGVGGTNIANLRAEGRFKPESEEKFDPFTGSYKVGGKGKKLEGGRCSLRSDKKIMLRPGRWE